ncbi:MAG: alpha/beta hydrolase [bacterium]
MAYVNNNKAKLYYQVIGEGKAITFAHGAGGNAASWFQQIPHFASHYKTIAFDHRAFARSACDPDDYSSEKFADDLLAILDDAGVEKTALVCQSLGGWTGISFSLKYPERVSCLVMSHTTGGISNEKIQAAVEDIAKTRAPASEPFGSWAVAADLPDKDPVKANLYNQIGNFNTRINLQKILGGVGGKRAIVTREMLANFNIPTLFITASMDVLIPPDAIYEAAKMIDGAQTRFFDGIGHSSYFECPDEFNAVVSEFVARHI